MADVGHQRRGLTLVQLFSLAFGTMVGIGWITLLGVWLKLAGPVGAALAFALGALVVLLIALVYAELATMFPVTGGEVVYAAEAFGPRMAAFVGALLLLIFVATIAFEAISVGWLFFTIVPAARGMPLYTVLGQTTFLGDLVAMLAVLALLYVINRRGAAGAALFQSVLTVGLLVAKVAFLLFGAMHADPAYLAPAWGGDAGGDWSGFLTVLAMTPFMFAGFNSATQAMGECARTLSLRRAALTIAASIGAALIFYVAVILIAGMLLPRERMLALDLPTAGALEIALGSRGWRDFVLIGGVLGMLTAWNGVWFAGARLLRTLAVQGAAPGGLARLDAHGAPHRAFITVALLALPFAFLGRGATLPLIASAGMGFGIVYTVVVVSAMRLRRRRPDIPRPFRLPCADLLFPLAAAAALFAGSAGIWDSLNSPNFAVQCGILAAWLLLCTLVMLVTRGQSPESLLAIDAEARGASTVNDPALRESE